MNALSYRADIDGLRAVAVLLVLLFHAELGFPGGYIGVDVFFVISGYLITGIIKSGLEKGSFSFAEFWRRRISRIAPAASAVVLASVLVGIWVLIPADLSELASSGVAQQLLLANVYFSDRVGYFEGPADLKPLLHMWSLAVEEQFYLGFPFLVVAAWRMGRRTLPTLIVVLGAASLLYSMYALPRDPAGTFFLLPSRAWELLLGAGLHWTPSLYCRRAVVAEAIAVVGLCCILIPAAIYSKVTPFPGLAAIPPCFGTALLIAAGKTNRSVVGRVLALRPLVFVGLISYSLYLVHWPLLAFLRLEHGLDLPLLTRAAIVPLSIIMAMMWWWSVEVPLRRVGARSAAWQVMAAFLIVTTLSVGGLASIRLLKGLPGRLGPEALAILATPPVDESVAREAKDASHDRLPTFGSCDGRIDCLVWGDSHASALVGAVELLGDSLDMCCAVAARYATVPLVETWRSGRKDPTLEWSEAVLEYVRRNRVRVVILMARWSVNVEGDSATDLGKLIGDAEESGDTPDSAARAMTRGLRRTVDALRAAGAKVVVVGQFPEHQTHPWRIMMRELQNPGRAPLATTRQAHEVRQRRIREAFDAIRDADGVTVIDPAESLFSSASADATAKLGDADGPFYVDMDHPSRNGAMKVLGPILVESVRRVLAESKD